MNQELRDAESRYGEAYFFLQLILLYVVASCAYNLSHSNIVRFIINLYAISIFIYCAVNILNKKIIFSINTLESIGLIIFAAGSISSLLYNGNSVYMGYQDFIKILMGVFFYFIGLASGIRPGVMWASRNVKKSYAALIFLPAIVFVANIFGIGYSDEYSLSIFANRNNAALYFLVVLSLYVIYSGDHKWNLIICAFVSLMFGTLGVLVATVVAVVVVLFKFENLVKSLPLILFVCVVGIVAGKYLTLGRSVVVFDTISLLMNGGIDIRGSSYAELTELLNTTDLSFIFRLKHWTNLFDILMGGSILNLLFGYGVGASEFMSDNLLVPHNDYMRIAFELGLFSFIGFAVIVASIVRSAFGRIEYVPLLVVCIYFFSENLINNYLCMMIMFYASGVLVSSNRNMQPAGYIKLV